MAKTLSGEKLMLLAGSCSNPAAGPQTSTRCGPLQTAVVSFSGGPGRSEGFVLFCFYRQVNEPDSFLTPHSLTLLESDSRGVFVARLQDLRLPELSTDPAGRWHRWKLVPVRPVLPPSGLALSCRSSSAAHQSKSLFPPLEIAGQCPSLFCGVWRRRGWGDHTW